MSNKDELQNRKVDFGGSEEGRLRGDEFGMGLGVGGNSLVLLVVVVEGYVLWTDQGFGSCAVLQRLRP